MMRKNLIWAILIIATALIQTTWLEKEQIKVLGVSPNLVLLLVIYFAVMEGEERAMFTGVLGGLFQDVGSGSVIGHHILCYVVVGFVTGRIAVRLITQHPAVKVGLVVMAGVLNGLLFVMIQAVQRIPGVISTAKSVVPATLYTALLTPIVFFLMDRLFQRYFSPQT
jgi:rod shape-determining protein MreD